MRYFFSNLERRTPDAGWPAAVVVAVLLTALASSPGYADYSVGGSFAAPGYGARAWGKGGAAIAWGADEGAVYWNPSLLGMLDRNRLGFSYVNLVPDTDAGQTYVAYSHIVKPGEADEPGLEFAAHAAGAIYSNLRLELSDGQSYSENAVRLSYAYSPLHFLTFGASFNVLWTTSDVLGFGANGTSLDAALRLGLLEDLTLGLVLRNVLSQLDFEDGTNQALPRAYTLGLAYEVLDDLVVEGDIETRFGGFSRAVVGGEYTVYNDMLSVRAGMSTLTVGENRSVAHLGLGVEVHSVRIDYGASFDNEEAFENTHRFSVGMGF